MRSTGAVPQWLARPLAIGGLVFFADALVYFVYRYSVTFGRELPGNAPTRAVVADVALFSIFALHHSLFARERIRRLVSRTAGSLERSFYVWVASALFIAVCALWQPIAGTLWRADTPGLFWLLTAAQLFGVWLTLRSASLIDIRDLAGLKQIEGAGGAGRAGMAGGAGGAGRAGRVEGADAASGVGGDSGGFKTNGPYGWVRHPIYSGWFLIVFAVPAMTCTRLVFAVTSSIYLLIAIPFEERSLRDVSHGAYDRYMREVRWKLVPRLF